MNAKRVYFLFLLLAALPLLSCSGVKNHGTTGGNAQVTITLYDTPPTGVSLLSFTLPITALSLKTSSTTVSLTPVVNSVEATRLQTDSVLLVDGAAVPAGSYTEVDITFGSTSASSNVFINSSGSSISSGSTSCANGAVCMLPSSGTSATITVPLTFTLSQNQSQWIGLDLNLNNAIVTTSGALTVDFSQANVLAATTTTRIGLPSGAVDTIEDFTGIVTALSGSSITVQNGVTGQKLTATLTTITEYDTPIPSGNAYTACGSSTAKTCLAVGSTVSIDAILTAAGALTATEVDILDATAVPEVEGIIYPTTTAGTFGLIVADKIAANNSVIGASTATYGTPIFLTVSGANNFAIDTKTLSPSVTTIGGFAGINDLLAGQQIRAQLTSVVSVSGRITANASNLLLRFSRVTGTVTNPGQLTFSFTPPLYISTLNPILGAPPYNAYVYNSTLYDGVAAGTGIPASTVSIRALLLDNNQPTFAVAKLRVP